jgi:uncharacterized GH25 family protein
MNSALFGLRSSLEKVTPARRKLEETDMNFTTLPRLTLLALLTTVLLPLSANAHRAWILPSSTVTSGTESWVTFDAAVSNDLFYFDHQPVQLQDVTAIAPDGSSAAIENASTGRYRSTFDVKLAQQGTYKISRNTETIVASYTVNGELRRFRGSSAAFAKEVPANAPDLKISKSTNRLEVFVTSGKPTTTALKPVGTGMELVPVTHPNDLFAGEKANFKLLADGKPQAGIEVTAIRGGIRYRDQLREIKVTTDANGAFSVQWPEAGMYWLNASTGAVARGPGGPPTADMGGSAAAVMPVVPGTRASYTAVLEVLPQ